VCERLLQLWQRDTWQEVLLLLVLQLLLLVMFVLCVFEEAPDLILCARLDYRCCPHLLQHMQRRRHHTAGMASHRV
jgi:hypothetical protein